MKIINEDLIDSNNRGHCRRSTGTFGKYCWIILLKCDNIVKIFILNLIPAVFQWKHKVYLQITIHYILLKVLFFKIYDLCLSFTQKMDSTPIEILAFWGNPFIDLFFDIFKRLKMLCLQIILNGSKQMMIRWCYVQWILRVRLSNSCPVYIFYGFCYTWTSIVIEQN